MPEVPGQARRVQPVDPMTLRTVKTWIITSGDVADAYWLKEQGIAAHYESNSIPFAVGNQTYYVKGQDKLTVETTTEKQELMLKLKFAPVLVLVEMKSDWLSQFD